MAKATSPYLSEVRGSVAKKLTFRKLSPYDTQLIQSIPIPGYRRTEKQNAQRNKFSVCRTIWNSMSDEDKESYRALGEELALTGYQSFMSKCLSELILYDIYIDNTQNHNDLVNFQVPLEITNDLQFFRDCNYNKNAISFMTEDLKNPVPYYIESWNPDTKSARIWLKVPLIKGGEVTTVKLLIVPSKQTTGSDGEAVFEFFDDFESTELDTSKWSEVKAQGTLAVEDVDGKRCLHLTTPSGSYNETIASTIQFGSGYVLEASIKADGDTWTGMGFTSADGGNIWVSSDYLGIYVGNNTIHGRARISGTNHDSNGFPISADFANVMIEWKSEDSVGIYYNGDLIHDYSGTTPSEQLKIGVGSEDAGDIWIDWVRVRKYADPFPSVTYSKTV